MTTKGLASPASVVRRSASVYRAQVTGLDFSPPADEAASRLATELGIDARFLTADVYDAVSAVEGETFDIVCAGFGALNWLPDISRWASVVAELLAPAGCVPVPCGVPSLQLRPRR